MLSVRGVALFLVAGSLLVGASAHAQALKTIQGTYSVAAHAEVPGLTDDESAAGVSTLGTFSKSASADVSTNDAFGYHHAYSSTGAWWKTTQSGPKTTLEGGVGAVAGGYADMFDVASAAGSTLSLEFEITTLSNVMFWPDGTYGSDLDKWNGSAWEQMFVGWQGPEYFQLAPGNYRWNVGAGESISGTTEYSSGLWFTLEAEAVPEPGSMAALAAGALWFGRRRKRG